MEPALTIISRCGGVGTVAGWLSLDRSSVLRWTYPRAKGGTDGAIPTRHQRDLLVKAVLEGKSLTAADFFRGAAEATPA